jgi:hypothetical protein
LIEFIDHKTTGDITAIQAGFSKGFVGVVKLLLDHGAAATTHNGYFTLLQRARAEGMKGIR